MAMRFTLRQIEYFVAVAELGSIAHAAERLRVSPPSISTAIAGLEAAFGLRLFIRHHAQGVSLTPEGRRFLHGAKALMDRAAALHGVADELTGTVRGPVAVGCLVVLAALVWPAVRAGFEAAHPHATVSCVTGHQGELLEKLRTAQVDVAITYDLGIPQDISFEPLATLPPHALLSPGHALAARDSLTLEELAGEDLLLLDLPLSREYFLALFREAGLKPRVAERIPDYGLLRSMVARGFGYALGNIRPVLPVAPSGEPLRTVPIAGRHRPMALGLATAGEGPRARIIAAFAGHCRGMIRDGTIPGMDFAPDS